MSIETLRASTGFKLNPMQAGTDDAFLGFISFAFGQSAEAQSICDEFVRDGGLLDTHNAGEIPAAAGKFVDWLIVNYWGEEPATDIAHPARQNVVSTDPAISISLE